eukprot:GHVN01088712.1.p1 GENE.GHVN01088712.1~~GHVN01088712.1.p1  ORF type:complete len:192 (-),score=9.19 GHVN01088712.1:42-617(-)
MRGFVESPDAILRRFFKTIPVNSRDEFKNSEGRCLIPNPPLKDGNRKMLNFYPQAYVFGIRDEPGKEYAYPQLVEYLGGLWKHKRAHDVGFVNALKNPMTLNEIKEFCTREDSAWMSPVKGLKVKPMMKNLKLILRAVLMVDKNTGPRLVSRSHNPLLIRWQILLLLSHQSVIPQKIAILYWMEMIGTTTK